MCCRSCRGCTEVVPASWSAKHVLLVKFDEEMKRLQKKWARLLRAKARVMRVKRAR